MEKERHTQRERDRRSRETSETDGEMETDPETKSAAETPGRASPREGRGRRRRGRLRQRTDAGTQSPRGARGGAVPGGRRTGAGRGGTGGYLRVTAGRGRWRLSPQLGEPGSTAAQEPGGDFYWPPGQSRQPKPRPGPAGPAPINPSFVAPP